MKKFLTNLKDIDFYKKNWHRLLVAPILFLGIFFSSAIYLISAGFYIIFYLSLLVGLIFSILFVIKYDKKHFFVLIFIVLLQIITVNIDTKNYEVYDGIYTIGKNSKAYDIYYKVNADCFGIKRNYYETTKCVGKITNCFIETFSQKNDQFLNKEIFPCVDYNEILKEKKDIRLQYLKEKQKK